MDTKPKSGYMMRQGWKIIGVVLVFYTIIAGLLGPVPALPILHETIRNLYFHVTMWFAMIALLCVSFYYSIRYLNKPDFCTDTLAACFSVSGLLMGLLGIATGSVWAKFTWGAWWVNDPKLNGAAVSVLIYLAYLILRNSLDEEQTRGRISAVYNIFAFVLMIVFLMVYPRLNKVDSLHPGNGGNPAFSAYDLDSSMRMVFYPAVIGWILIGSWISNLAVRIKIIEYRQLTREISNFNPKT